MSAELRLSQQPRQVLCKDLDRMFFRMLGQMLAYISLDCRQQQPFGRVVYSQLQLLGPHRAPIRPEHPQHCAAPIAFCYLNLRTQDLLSLAPVDCQNLIVLDPVDPVIEFIISLEDSPLVLAIRYLFRGKDRLLKRLLAGLPPYVRVVADRLGDDVAGPGQRLFDRRHLRVQIRRGQLFRRFMRTELIQEVLCES